MKVHNKSKEDLIMKTLYPMAEDPELSGKLSFSIAKGESLRIRYSIFTDEADAKLTSLPGIQEIRVMDADGKKTLLTLKHTEFEKNRHKNLHLDDVNGELKHSWVVPPNGPNGWKSRCKKLRKTILGCAAPTEIGKGSQDAVPSRSE